MVFLCYLIYVHYQADSKLAAYIKIANCYTILMSGFDYFYRQKLEIKFLTTTEISNFPKKKRVTCLKKTKSFVATIKN